MLVVIGGKDNGTLGVLSVNSPWVLIPATFMAVELLEVGRIFNVQLVWTDTDDRTCTSKMEQQLAMCQDSHSRTNKSNTWMQVYS